MFRFKDVSYIKERKCPFLGFVKTANEFVLCDTVPFTVNSNLDLLRQGLSEPDIYGDLMYKLKKIVGSNNFSAQFIKIISHYKKIGYKLMYCNRLHARTACLVVNPITVGNFAFPFNCTSFVGLQTL